MRWGARETRRWAPKTRSATTSGYMGTTSKRTCNEHAYRGVYAVGHRGLSREGSRPAGGGVHVVRVGGADDIVQGVRDHLRTRGCPA